MGGDQLVVHVARMRGGVAQPRQAVDLGQGEQQPAEAPDVAPGALAVIGVDVLAQEGDLARARRDQAPGLGQNRRSRPGLLGASGIGHDAEGAELVAALLDREIGGGALRPGFLGQVVELRFRGEAGVDDAGLAARRLGHQRSQAVIGLRTEDQIDLGRAAKDLLAFGLGDAAGHGDHHPAAAFGPGRLEPAQAAELGKDLLAGLLADMAGVQDHEVRRLRRLRRAIAERRQDVRHPQGVVDVHLTAVGLDVELLAHLCGFSSGRRAPP